MRQGQHFVYNARLHLREPRRPLWGGGGGGIRARDREGGGDRGKARAGKGGRG